jgi:hypothetical protein
MRLELEKNIKNLENEVNALKNVNKQLLIEKESIQNQFIEYKVKSEDTITDLRGFFFVKTVFI